MREALDPHLKIAGVFLNTERPWGERFKSLLAAAKFYPFWYLKQWLPFGAGAPAGMHPRLAGHMDEVAGLSRRLARTLFHQMVKFGPKLEKRQVLLGRIADIGTDLFAIAATFSTTATAAGKSAISLSRIATGSTLPAAATSSRKHSWKKPL